MIRLIRGYLVVCVYFTVDLMIIPKDMTAFISGTAQFLCSNLPPGSVQWSFKSITSPNPVIIYTDMFGITKDFELGGRHHVELNTSAGTCSLTISKISRDDAGVYSCGTDYSTDSANLVVIGEGLCWICLNLDF